MKKITFAFAVILFTACGSGDNSTNYSDSSSPAPKDTTSATNPRIPDTATLHNDTSHVMGDTTNMQKDTPMSR